MIDTVSDDNIPEVERTTEDTDDVTTPAQEAEEVELTDQKVLAEESDANAADEGSDELRLDLYIEALIFAAEYALNVEEIRKTVNLTFDQKFKKQHIQELIDNIRDKYEDSNLAIQLTGIAGGYLFMTKAKYLSLIHI